MNSTTLTTTKSPLTTALGSVDKWHRDYISKDEQHTVDSVFEILISELPTVKSQYKDEAMFPVITEMLVMSREAFRDSFNPIYNIPYISKLLFPKKKWTLEKKAIYILQEIMGIIWPSQKMPEKYESIAREEVSRRT